MRTPYQVEQRHLLEQEVERLQQQIEQQEALAQPIPWQVGDEGDHALNLVTQTNRQVLLGHLRRKLIQVESALVRLNAGKYGTCAKCSRPIPPERLEAIPYATLCVRCQSQQDHVQSVLSR